MLALLKPGWNAAAGEPLEEKCAVAGLPFNELAVFPFTEALRRHHRQECIRAFPFAAARFVYPHPSGLRKAVLRQLDGAGITWRRVSSSCIAFSNAAKIDGLLELNKEAVVQDYSSQRIGELLELAATAAPIRNVWDRCAASGGKSILAKDILGDIKLTVSDLRKSILVNLEKRFAEAGITHYTSSVEDLSVQGHARMAPGYDLIIADVPCSGSGTWGRTPESLSFFKQEAIARYQALQKQIVGNAFSRLKKGGCFLYITCSVFKQENEDMVAFIKDTLHLRLLSMETFKGYSLKADTMFAALFVNANERE